MLCQIRDGGLENGFGVAQCMAERAGEIEFPRARHQVGPEARILAVSPEQAIQVGEITQSVLPFALVIQVGGRVQHLVSGAGDKYVGKTCQMLGG